MEPVFFATSAQFRAWLERNHDKTSELVVGYYKKASGKPSISYPESVDQALCFGWIDGVRRTIDDVSYSNRFSPRTATSNWSLINVRRLKELQALGLVRPAGLRAFEKRREDPLRSYSYETAPRRFAPAYEKRFRANAKAWRHFSEQSPSYRRVSTFWVMSARKEETRERRLAKLIEISARGRRLI
jgi:uncharacterized protein YdeI (YjbR/CyaY-like superfamily)